jgi:hypothetical protein
MLIRKIKKDVVLFFLKSLNNVNAENTKNWTIKYSNPEIVYISDIIIDCAVLMAETPSLITCITLMSEEY